MTVNVAEDPWQAIGHGVSIQRRYIDGELMGVAYRHPCAEGVAESWVHVDGPGPWSLVSADPLHIEPSLLCRVCGHHGFIRDGLWVPA